MQRDSTTKKTLEELKEQETELIRQNEEDRAVINDENATPSEREAAEARVAERQEELARLRTQIREREKARPLWERVKDIFKKYGWTLQAVVLAASLVIGAVVLKIMTALKSGIKAVGNGLKEIRKKNRLPFARPKRLDHELHFQSCGAGHFFSVRTCADIDPCRRGVLDRTDYKTQPLNPLTFLRLS